MDGKIIAMEEKKRPSSEDLLRIREYRKKGDNEKVMSLIEGLDLNGTDSVIDKILIEASICAYYTGMKDVGRLLSEALLLGSLSTSEHNLVRGNQIFYCNKIPRTKCDQYNQLEAPIEGTGVKYAPCNPSIIKAPKGYLLNVRMVNYSQVGGRHFTVHSPDKVVRTINSILLLDDDMKIVSDRRLIDKSGRKAYPTMVRGMEDIRLFYQEDTLRFFCTLVDANPKGIPQMAIGTIEEGEDVMAVTKLTVMKGPVAGRCEKNWVPYVKGGTIFAVYQTYPLKIYIVTPNKSLLASLPSLEYHKRLTDIRGGSPPVEFNDGLLFVTHQVVMFSGRRRYTHRFISYSEDYAVVTASLPFVFETPEIEFCLGMCYDSTGSNLLLSVGLEDKKARVYTVSMDTVKSLLAEGRDVEKLVTFNDVKWMSKKSDHVTM